MKTLAWGTVGLVVVVSIIGWWIVASNRPQEAPRIVTVAQASDWLDAHGYHIFETEVSTAPFNGRRGLINGRVFISIEDMESEDAAFHAAAQFKALAQDLSIKAGNCANLVIVIAPVPWADWDRSSMTNSRVLELTGVTADSVRDLLQATPEELIEIQKRDLENMLEVLVQMKHELAQQPR